MEAQAGREDRGLGSPSLGVQGERSSCWVPWKPGQEAVQGWLSPARNQALPSGLTLSRELDNKQLHRCLI